MPHQLPELTRSIRKKYSIRDLKEDFNDFRTGDIGPIDYEIGLKQAILKAQIKDAMIKGKIGYDGTWGLNIQKPMFGGDMSLDVNGGDNTKYMLRFNKRF